MRNYPFPNPETKICLTIGHPVDKQKSLYMHNAGYEALGLNYLYLVRDIPPQQLAQGVNAMIQFGVSGMSVTMPHKVNIIATLDEMTPAVEKIGACNTVHVQEGKTIGYNSDVIGALTCLKKKTELKAKRAIVLGAGGAARSVVYGLLEEGCEVVVLNRTQKKAQLLGNDFGIRAYGFEAWNDYRQYDIVVNATSVGSRREEDCTCRLCKLLYRGEEANILFDENKVALDVVFQRNQTEFTKLLQGKGYNIVYGHEMLVAQGAFQFELFTGHQAPVEVMYTELKKNLESW